MDIMNIGDDHNVPLVPCSSWKSLMKVNKIYEQYFVDNKPARACFAVKQLPRNALVEIEAIAYKK